MGKRARAKWAEKWEGTAVPLSVGGAGSPSNKMPPGPQPTSVPSGILVHPTVWPQHTNVTDRQTRHTRQGFRSIGRTCNGRPKQPGLYTQARPLHGQK